MELYGNVTADANNVNQYLYDAEGRVCAVANTPVPGMTIMTGYVYDADGNRVAKGTITSWSCDPTANGLMSAENETEYILDIDGKPVTEMAQDDNGDMQWQRTYVYAGGGIVGTYDPSPNPAYNPSNPSGQSPVVPTLSFRLTDWQGTMRATTDSSGVPQGTCTGLPFGDGVACQGNIPDPHHFTGKERDAESGNDYFGARYYTSSMGRFLTPDWAAKPATVPYASFGDPQTLNLYSYVENAPMNRVDADGHDGVDSQQRVVTIGCGSSSSQGLCDMSDGPSPAAVSQANAGDDNAIVTADTRAANTQAAASTGNSAANAPQDQNQAQQQDGQQVAQVDKDKVANYMDTHTNDTDTYHHHCAAVCHAGLAAGGLGYDKDRPSNAGENGPWLEKHGAQAVGHSDNTDLPKGYSPQKGDVAVFSGGGPKHNPIGHMEIYDGKQWVSDTKQTTFSPGRTYGGSVTVYRFPN